MKPETMKFFVLAVFLCGCHHRITDPTVSTPDYSRTLIVGAGQSNMSGEHLSDTFLFSNNVAIGGSSIDQWQKSAIGLNFQPNYYQTMRAAIGTTSNAVIFWWQGESEGLHSIPGTDNWSGQFIQMVKDIRADTGYRLPVYYVEIGTTSLETYGNWDGVRAEQVAAQRMLPDLHLINIDDLGSPQDGLGQIHYSQDQYHIVQKRMLQAYTQIGD